MDGKFHPLIKFLIESQNFCSTLPIITTTLGIIQQQFVKFTTRWSLTIKDRNLQNVCNFYSICSFTPSNEGHFMSLLRGCKISLKLFTV